MRQWLNAECAVVAQARSLSLKRLLIIVGVNLQLVPGVMVGSASPAWALCTPAAVDATNPAPGTSVTCSGTTTDQNGTSGYGTGDQTGITVNVGATASVTGTASGGIHIGDGTVVNLGNISGSPGVVAATGSVNVTNSGSVTGGSVGVFAKTNVTLTNTIGGIITGSYGVEASTGSATVVNSGSITGTSGYGILAQADATVTNNVGASISGGLYGIAATFGLANITNAGTITGTGNAGIEASDGMILVNYASGIVTSAGFGIRTFGFADITNSGRITSAGLSGIVAAGPAAITNNAGGIISGDIGIFLSAGNSTIFNAGTISGTGNYGIFADSTANVVNAAGGLISGGVYGLRSLTDAVNLTNSGNITGGGVGVFAKTNVAVTNNIGGIITGSYGIEASTGSATVVNSGSITGINGYGILAQTDATVTNSVGASISGGSYGIAATFGFANITNAGTITGTGNSGIEASDGVILVNYASGIVTSNGFGIRTFGFADITNSGRITSAGLSGIVAAGPAAITNNAGGIISGDIGIFLSAGNSTIFNAGTISGTGNYGIFADSTANVVNAAGGLISGGAYGLRSVTDSVNLTNSGAIVGSGAYGILADANAKVINNFGGTISGGQRAISATNGSVDITNFGSISTAGSVGIFAGAGNSRVFNAGTIDATGIIAVLFSGSGNVLTLAPGSTINGSVRGAGSDTLQLGGSGGGTFDVSSIGMQYSGFGAFNKIDASVFTLVGTSTFAGPVKVDGGSLDINGNTASFASLTVNAGGTLGGTGIVGSTTVNGGTLAPGNSIGTLTVQGSLAFAAAATYLVEISPTNADRTDVTGTATLAGTVNATFAPGAYVAKQYTILSATSVNGRFGSLVTTQLPSGFLAALDYDDKNVYLNLSLGFTQYSNLNANQRNVADALTNFFNTTGGIPAVFAALSPAGLTQVSGEAATGAQQTTFQAMDQFIGVLLDPSLGNRGGGTPQGGSVLGFAQSQEPTPASNAYAAVIGKAQPHIANLFTSPWSVWATGYGGTQTTDGNATVGSNTATSRLAGVALGADYRLSPDTLAGFAFGGGGTNYGLANGLGRGSSDLFQAGAFVHHTAGAAYFKGAVAYGWQNVTTDRTLTVAGQDLLRARFDANAISGRIESGYRFATPWMGITPHAAGQFTTFYLPNYTEQIVAGASTFALAYAAKDATASRSELGLRTDKSYALETAILTLRGRAAWAHNFDPDRSIGATFQTLPGASFVVSGAALANDAALVSAAVELKWLNGLSFAGAFDGEFSDVTRSFAGKGVVRYQW